MNSPRQFDFLLVGADSLRCGRVKVGLEAVAGGRVSQHSTARSAIGAFMRARFDAVVIASPPGDSDAWRFLRMLRSGRFGFGQTPAFLLCVATECDAILPMLDAHTGVVECDDIQAVPEAILRQLQDAKRDRVLIVEDEPHASAAAERALTKYFQTDTAADGETALADWQRERHDLVLLDLMLPGMPGRDVLGSILRECPTQPIVVLTAHDDIERHQDLILVGASEFLSKPIDVHFLADACARVLRESRHVSTLELSAAKDRQLEELAARVHAADYSLRRGRTSTATRHLEHAVKACRFHAPSDDQWTSLLDDFN